MEETPTLPLPYTIVPMEPVQIFVKPHCAKWNLAQPDYLSVISNPITTSADNGFSFTAVARCLRTDAELSAHVYYLEEPNTPHGWDANDCVIENVSVQNSRPALPKGALPIPINTSDLVLDVDVKGYGNQTDAARGKNYRATLPAGNYLIFQKADNGMLYVSENRETIKYWINPADNVMPVPEPLPEVGSPWIDPRSDSEQPEPVVEEEPEVVEPVEDFTWKDTYVAYSEARIYKVNQGGRAWNDDETQPQTSVELVPNDYIYVIGWYVRDGQKYYRLKTKGNIENGWWVSVPQTYNDRAVLVFPTPKITWAERWFHRHIQTKSIFTTNLKTGVKLIDTVKNPYKDKKGIK